MTQTAYTLGPVADHVRAAASEIGGLFDIGVVYGFGPGSVADSDHPKGLALDFMTTSKSKGDALSAYAIANADRLGVKYIIWYRRVWRGGSWSPYTATSNPHTDHVHISFVAENDVSLYPNVGGSGRGAPMRQATDITDPFKELLRFPVEAGIALAKGEDPREIIGKYLLGLNFWRRVGMAFLGTTLIGVAILFFMRKPIKNVVTVTGREAASVMEMVFGGAAIGVGQNLATRGSQPVSGAIVSGAPRRVPKPPPAPITATPATGAPRSPVPAPQSPGGTWRVTDLASRPRTSRGGARGVAKRPPTPLTGGK